MLTVFLKKNSLLSKFKTQISKDSKGRIYFERDKIFSFHVNYFATKVGVKYVETFKIVRHIE